MPLPSSPKRHAFMSMVGHRLQLAREEKGWSLDRLAQALKVEPFDLQAFEAGERWIGSALLMNTAKSLDMPIEKLIDPSPVDELSAIYSPDVFELVGNYRVVSPVAQRMLRNLAQHLASAEGASPDA